MRNAFFCIFLIFTAFSHLLNSFEVSSAISSLASSIQQASADLSDSIPDTNPLDDDLGKMPSSLYHFSQPISVAPVFLNVVPLLEKVSNYTAFFKFPILDETQALIERPPIS